jgi:ClpP class serine protease
MENSKRPARRVLNAIANERWAILPESLQIIMDIASREHVPDFDAVLAKRGRPLGQEMRSSVRGATAVIPITGPIFRYANVFTQISGATSVQEVASELRAALDQPTIDSIVLEINSPGGQVTGISELAQMIRAADKPVIAYVDGMAASAAYWIASAASQIVVNDTAQLGSIGVVTQVAVSDDEDLIEIVSTQSPRKRPDVRTEDGKAQIQANTDELARVFIDTVARNRKVSAETVAAEFGAGGLLIGQSAVDAGMADRVGSLEGLLVSIHDGVSDMTKVALTREQIAADYPEIAEAFRAEGRADASALSAARAEGAAAELQRIQAVRAVALAGHEALIEQFMFDGQTTGPEAAARVIEAERQKRGERLTALRADAASAVAAAAEAPAGKPAVDETAPLEDRCRAEWQTDPSVRADFGDDFDSYLACRKAEEGGRVRRLAARTTK